MNPKRAVDCLLAFIIVFIIFCAIQKADASMLEQFPKRFSLTGVVELTYSDFFYGLPTARSKVESDSAFLEQRYTLGARGFIYHPRLAVFGASISYIDARQVRVSAAGKVNSHGLGYDLRLTLLPYRPISLAVYAGSNDFTTVPIGSFINQQWAVTQSINYNYYGASLKINKPPLPFMRLEYNHEAQDVLRNNGSKPGTIQSDAFLLDLRGSLRLWNTVYLGMLQYEDFSSPSVSYKAKDIRLSSSSSIRKGIYLQNSFNYSDIDFSKLLSFSAQLNIDRDQLFKQFYYYNFLQSRESFRGLAEQGIAGQDQKETVNSLTGSWLYRFVNGPFLSLSLNYGRRNETTAISETASFYGISFSASYGKSFLGLNFTPSFRSLYRKDELKGQLFENNLELNLVTRKIRWGTVYSDYSLTVLNEEDKFRQAVEDESGFGEPSFVTKTTKVDSITHVFRTGVRGRGPGKRLSKAQWSLEAQIFFSDATIERELPDFFFDEDVPVTPKTERFKRSIRRYSMLGHASYPIGWATVFFSAGASVGQSNGASLRKLFYEERISYPIIKNCWLLVRWKELWEKVAETPNRKVDEYDLSAEYRIGQTTISLSGAVLKADSNGQEINVRRLFLRLRRTIF